MRGSDVVDKHYIDPTVLPTPAAFELWFWALTRQYHADAGVIEWRRRCCPTPTRRRSSARASSRDALAQDQQCAADEHVMD